MMRNLHVNAAAGTAYLTLRNHRISDIAETITVGDVINLDFDRRGNLVGLEILDIHTALPWEEVAKLANR